MWYTDKHAGKHTHKIIKLVKLKKQKNKLATKKELGKVSEKTQMHQGQ